MKPIVFGGRFGWLHAGTSNRGVILCGTYGHESVWTRNGMRYLADELSARGIWVLRFDYLGTGDSVGADDDPEQFDTSIRDIHAAIEALEAQAQIEHVSLCGFRVGAAFALAAALQKPVDDLVLLAPVVSGRTYMRELSIVRKTWLEQLAPPLRAFQPEAPLNVLGQIYCDGFRHALEKIDLVADVNTATRAPAVRVLVMQARASANDPLCDAFRRLGTQVESSTFEDLTGFAQETAFSVLPERTFAQAIEWMSAGCSRVMPSFVSIEATNDLAIETPEAVERPVWIEDKGLFGILCEPRTMTTRGPVYVLANTSASAHVGDSRLSVRIARELARRGVASLRVDAHGRGDSPADPAATQNGKPFANIYDPIATDDTAAAARWLVAQGYKTVFTFGICSGAYHALKAGVVEKAISGVVAVNIPTFKMPERRAPNAPRAAARNSMAGYAISIFDPKKWKTVLSGEKNLLPIVRFVVSNLFARLRSRLVDTLGLDALNDDTPPEHATEPSAMMRVLNARGVNTVLVHGAFDASMDVIAAHFGARGTRLSRLASVRMAIFDDVDHALFNPVCSAQVIALCEEVIKKAGEPVVQTTLPVGAPAIS